MQDLNHDFTPAPASADHAARTTAALRSIERARAEQVRAGYAVLMPYAGLNPKSPVVGLARLFVIGALGIWANYLLYMQVWGGQ